MLCHNISLKKILINKFDMQDLGDIDVILKIKIIGTCNRLVMSQSHYVKKILDKFFIGENSTIKTPMNISIIL